MKPRTNLILTTSPLSQPARKPRKNTSFARRQRLLYGRKRHHPIGKERDKETGLYYYGARYLDSRTGRWISGDPAVGDYVPEAPINDEARKRNGNLPGQGGVFNYVNLHVYHYAGNNPVKYIDPNGLSDEELDLIQKAANYLKSECDKYIESLKEEANISGRATLSVNFARTINGYRVKGSFTGVAEKKSNGDLAFTLEAGLDIGIGTPGQELLSTGANATFGLRASFGEYRERDTNNGLGSGLRTISLAANIEAAFAGLSTMFEFRKEIMNFDKPSGVSSFTLFNSNTYKFGVRSSRQLMPIPGIGTLKIGGGGRINGF